MMADRRRSRAGFRANIDGSGLVASTSGIAAGGHGPEDGLRPTCSGPPWSCSMRPWRTCSGAWPNGGCPTAPPGSLERIPLAGSGKPTGRNSPWWTWPSSGARRSMRSSLDRSAEYLERSSYNHPGEIAELLMKIG